jgi:WD40 repeat protein/DNA-binding SARP family transcriptional activator
MGVDFGILGSIEAVAESGPIRLGGRKQRAVLAILLVNANRVVPVEKLADDLYDGAAPATAVAQVRDHVSQLRKLLEPAANSILETRSPGYVLRVEPDQLDAVRFETMVEQASGELRRGEAEPAARRLREALALWRGPVLADFAYESFAQPAIGRLEELRLAALEHRIEADLQLGQDGALAGELEALVAEHPLREQFRAQLMLALYRSGRQAEAVDLYHTGRRALVDEFGIEPSAELRELASRMLRQDPALASAGRPVTGPAEAAPDHEIRNPYKGLHAFLEADAEDFFGREQLTQELVERLAAERFLAVVGPSGSGKSSVVLAGLVPALRAGGVAGSGEWHVVELSAGAYPLEELEAALLRIAVNPPPSLMEQLVADELGLLRVVKRVLPDDGSELLLVVDQLEEVFTLVEDDARRAHFLSMLERAVRDPQSRLRVVTTLRADFYDRPLLYRDFAELLRGRVETVLPLSPDELERAIAGPARQVGLRLEEGLLAEIVADVLDEPGALPLLQYALTELYEQREGTMLTRSGYAAIGGISGALVGRAEALYEGLNAVGKEAVRQLFLRLVTLGESADTRRRVDRAELDSLDVDQGQLALAIEAFGASRLLSFDRDPRTLAATVEVAHEALLDTWERLRDWIAAERENLRAHQRLSTAAREWLETSRDPSFLLRGSQLARFELWAAESRLAQTELEREYLEASTAARRAEEAAEETRRAREAALERRSVNRLRALVGVLVIAALVAAGLTVFAFDQSSRSQRQAKIATARQLAAASVANLDVDPQLSILLARRAVETTGGGSRALPEAVEALHRAVAASRVVRTIPTQATAVSFSPDGSRLATAGSSHVTVWEAKTGRKLFSPGSTAPPFHGVTFSPDGSRLAAGGDDGSATVWSAHSGRRLVVLSSPVRGASIAGLRFSPDGTMLAADNGAGDVWIWDVPGRRVLRTIRTGYPLCGVAWSPDGTRVGTGDCGTHYSGSSARIWDVQTGRLVFTTKMQVGAIPTVDFSPDGRYLGTPNLAGFAQVWDIRTGRLVATFKDHTGEVLALAFSPVGQLVATSSTDGTARVWETLTGRQLLVLSGHRAAVGDLAFSGDGRRLATASQDGTVRIWDATPEGSRDWLTISAHRGGVESDIYSPNSAQLLTTGLVDGRAKLWNARTGALLHSYVNARDVGATFIGGSGLPPQVSATSPDASMGAEVQKSDGTVQLRDTATGDVLATLGNHAQSAAFDSVGNRIAVGNADGTVQVWDVRSRPVRLLRGFVAHNGLVDGVAFSPDGTLLATAGEDTTAKLWDLRTGKHVLTLTGPTLALTAVAFSPDGKRLVTGSRDGTVRVYVLPVDELMAVARSRLTRGWTKEECARYLPGGRCPSHA